MRKPEPSKCYKWELSIPTYKPDASKIVGQYGGKYGWDKLLEAPKEHGFGPGTEAEILSWDQKKQMGTFNSSKF